MKRRMKGLLALLCTGAVLVPTAAWAAVSFRNSMSSGIDNASSCIIQQPGTNAATFTNGTTGPLLVVDGTTSMVGTTQLLQTTITAKGYPGERTVYSDVLRIRNMCDVPGIVTLLLEPDSGGVPSATGVWSDLNMSLHLSAVSAPIATADLGDVRWLPLAASLSGGTIASPLSGSVTVAAGDTAQIALVIDAGSSASTTDSAQLRWTTQVDL